MLKRFLITIGLCACIGLVEAATVAQPAVPARPAPQPAELALVRHTQTLDLPENITALMQQYKIPVENLSVYIRDLNADVPMVVHNDKVPRNPASTMKLVTTWTALKRLGPAYTWKTESWLRGELKDGVLNGDLILKGYGDPFLTDESFWQLLHDLQLKGLKEVRGNLIVDNSYFSLPDYNPADFDNEPTRVYNAPPSALMFNFQASRFLFEADSSTGKVGITPFPLIPGLQLENSMVLSKGKCSKAHYRPDFEPDGAAIRVKGAYSADCGKNFVLRVMSTPEQHVFNAFRDMWRSLGGVFNGKLQTGQVREGDVLLDTHESRTLGEQIRFVNKWSNNVMARQMLLTVGAALGGAPATLDKGRIAIAGLLHEEGIDYSGMIVDNGSGLSRHARLTARQLGELLEAAWRDPYMPEFMASMPLLGEDGTLAGRFKGDDLKGRSHMKTGTLNDATAIAGYMLTRSGKRLIVVLQHNGREAQGSGRRLQDAILKWAFEQ
ncbi:D-alanyl-D-alanine carboxypeptidase/D-alanyl-D-alanine endopeptidase [Thiothrix nivea]|uniref:D-alanyl-D-alaninecarboxypeptidase/D-alanyl-D-al anine-endopeptidase n=1 Tax=Thiothrix nivea (strain ATCC 35100 / DSM 5205 / JP2) TaxID=870187 RepID=A0A656HJV7_THINJ|nr:D-alanyl-D-alanine carboxypeptidase/D-alanyl-D-alanine-endopeptidase [Thiothrix nivea]EIJ35796.1 D-alanyl-D-alaninecarboxypeptidase/D-alanyl-D-al anine-endopeptidase [Thiothrix nivea DSM 5205]